MKITKRPDHWLATITVDGEVERYRIEHSTEAIGGMGGPWYLVWSATPSGDKAHSQEHPTPFPRLADVKDWLREAEDATTKSGSWVLGRAATSKTAAPSAVEEKHGYITYRYSAEADKWGGQVTAHDGSLQVGTLWWGPYRRDHCVIDAIEVNAAYRRQGIATKMLEIARREFPYPIYHSRILTEDGAAWAQKVGVGGLASDVTYNVQTNAEGGEVWAMKGTERIGRLAWSFPRLTDWEGRAAISGVWTREDHRRQGIAAEMLRRAREAVDYPIEHSPVRTGDGEAWAQAVASKTAKKADLSEYVLRHDSHANGAEVLSAYKGHYGVASIEWFGEGHPHRGEIAYVFVVPHLRRQGIATALLAEARRRVDYPIYHSKNLSEDGEAWATVTSARTASGPFPADFDWDNAMESVPEHLRGEFRMLQQQMERSKDLSQPSGTWYHASRADLAPGTHLTPGGGEAPSAGFYQQGFERRADHLWVTPDRQDASFWAATQNAPFIYEVEPDDEPTPWNGTGTDGWVCSGARVIRQVSKMGTRVAYQGRHQADPDDPTMDRLDELFPADVYEHPERYSIHGWGGREFTSPCADAIRRARGNPGAQVTVYRAQPPGIDTIETGNWVTPSRDYAEVHRESNGEPDWHIVSATVRAGDLVTGANDIVEWGYFGPTTTATKTGALMPEGTTILYRALVLDIDRATPDPERLSEVRRMMQGVSADRWSHWTWDKGFAEHFATELADANYDGAEYVGDRRTQVIIEAKVPTSDLIEDDPKIIERLRNGFDIPEPEVVLRPGARVDVQAIHMVGGPHGAWSRTPASFTVTAKTASPGGLHIVDSFDPNDPTDPEFRKDYEYRTYQSATLNQVTVHHQGRTIAWLTWAEHGAHAEVLDYHVEADKTHDYAAEGVVAEMMARAAEAADMPMSRAAAHSPIHSLGTTRTAARLTPADVARWEAEKPWNQSREDVEFQRIGYLYLLSRPRSSGHMASYDDVGGSGRIGLTPAFFDMPEDTRRAILYHEAGHGMESDLSPSEVNDLFGVENPLDVLALPGADRFGYNHSEILAQAYSVIWTEPQWATFPGAQEILQATAKAARMKGWPLPSGAPRTASMDVDIAPGTPLDYPYGGTPYRLSITEPGVGPGGGTYFDGDLVAFLDAFVDDHQVFIAYMAVRPSHRRQGLARRLVQAVYDRWGDLDVYWGDVMHDGAEALWREYQGRYPDRGNRGRIAASQWQWTPGGHQYRTSIVGKNGTTYYLATDGGFDQIVAFIESPFGSEMIKRPVGRLHVWTWKGRREIHRVQVNEEHRRQGVASAMLALAREGYPDLQHAQPVALSPDGKAWSQAVAVHTAATGAYWRVHPKGRPWGEEVTSRPFLGPGEAQEGYSCFEDPWHLLAYVITYWGAASGSQVVSFTGQRVGTGYDGEPLVVPDGPPRSSLDWDEFVAWVQTQPRPRDPGPAFVGRTWDTRPYGDSSLSERIQTLAALDLDGMEALRDAIKAEAPVTVTYSDRGGIYTATGTVVGGGDGWLALSDWPDRRIEWDSVVSVHPLSLAATAALTDGATRNYYAPNGNVYEMRYMTSDQGERKPRHIIRAYDGAKQVGELNWYGTTGTIHNIDVEQDYSRQGIATAMWEWAQEEGRPRPKHSGDRTTQGDAWARSVGGPLPRRKGSAGWVLGKAATAAFDPWGPPEPWTGSAEQMAMIEAVRRTSREAEGTTTGMCHEVTEWVEYRFGLERIGGFYVWTKGGQGRVTSHYWNLLPNGDILDPTADQFGSTSATLVVRRGSAEAKPYLGWPDVEGTDRYGEPYPSDAQLRDLGVDPANHKQGGATKVEAVGRRDEVPAEPGTTPIGSGQIRVYHTTDARNIESIRSGGLRLGSAVGSTYGEPNLVWGSARLKDYDLDAQVVVEFTLDWQRILDHAGAVVGGPSPGSRDNPSAWMSRGGNIGVPWDVPAGDIIAIHEPWHHRYRYIADSPVTIEMALAGEYDDLLSDPGYGKAIQEVKRKFGSLAMAPSARSAGEGDFIRTAATTQTFPEYPGLIFEVGDGYVWVYEGASTTSLVGDLNWEVLPSPVLDAALISWVWVRDDRQRQGIATKMLELARASTPYPIYHSEDLTDDGAAWARRVGSAALRRVARPKRVPQWVADTYDLEFTSHNDDPNLGVWGAEELANRILRDHGYATGLVVDMPRRRYDEQEMPLNWRFGGRPVNSVASTWIDEFHERPDGTSILRRVPTLWVGSERMLTSQVIVHEVAHLLVQRSIRPLDGHGSYWRQVYGDLSWRYLGRSPWEAAGYGGVSVAAERKEALQGMADEIREALLDLDLPVRALDGDCLPVSGLISSHLKERGWADARAVMVMGYVDFMDKEVLGIGHAAVKVGDYIVDATATQYDPTLPSLIIEKVPDYERILGEATGTRVRVEGGRFASSGWVLGKAAMTREANFESKGGSVFLALLPEDPEGLALDVEGAEDPDVLHVTLAYVGKEAEVDDEAKAAMRDFVSDLGRIEPFTATVVDISPLGNDDPPATVLHLDAPEAHALRREVEAHLEGFTDEQVPSLRDHPDYKCHLTIGYGTDPNAPEVQALMGREIRLDRAVLTVGDEQIEVHLVGAKEAVA